MDAEEIARLVKDLRVSGGNSEKGVTITKDEAAKGQRRLEKVVVGKIFSRRVIGREVIRSNLPRILRSRGNTEIEVVGNNLFVISFSLECDKRVALEEGPWHFFQDLMIIKQSKAMQTPMEVEFEDISLWVQCHNVPLECMDPEIITRIGAQVGTVEEVDANEGGLCVGKFARVRVNRPINEPLVRCVPLKQEGLEKDVLVILQYEKLPDFCFLCGRVGHISRDCKDDTVDKHHPRFDSWLRAGKAPMGRREAERGNRFEAKTTTSGSSGSRWVAIRSEDRVEEAGGSKEMVAMGGSMRGSGGEDRGVEMEEELLSSNDSPDVCMEGALDLNSGSGKEKGSEAEIVADPHRAEGVEGEGRDSSGPITGKKTVLVRSEVSGGRKSGGKGWKRLARVKKDGADIPDGVGGSERKGGGAREKKRKGEVLLGREEAVGDERNPKQAKVLGGQSGVDIPAVAAAQPRQSS